MTALSEMLYDLRKQKNIAQKDIAQALNISNASYNMYEKGKREPNINMLQKIADYFGVSLDFLMTGKENVVTEKAPELTARDERDIAKDLDRIMREIRNGDDGPLYYNGAEIDKASLSLLQNAIEYALRETKKENKAKYNPNKINE